MALLKIRDEQGNIIEIPSLRGPKGDKGDKGDTSYDITSLKTDLIFPSRAVLKTQDGANIPDGDFTIIKLKDKNILIDVGGDTTADRTIRILKSYNITHLDYIIISHYHLDHVGGGQAQGLIDLITKAPDNNIKIEDLKLYLPHGNINYDSIIGNEGIKLCANKIITDLSDKVQIVYPSDGEVLTIDSNHTLTFFNLNEEDFESYYNCMTDAYDQEQSYTSYNNFSMCVTLQSFTNRILFTGDIEPYAQEKLVNRHSTLLSDINIYKVEHHGLNSFVNEAYKNLLEPAVSIILRREHESDNQTSHITAMTTYLNSISRVFCNAINTSGTIRIKTYEEGFDTDCDGTDLSHSLAKRLNSIEQLAVNRTLVNADTGYTSLMKWCNEHVREGLQIIQLGAGLIDLPDHIINEDGTISNKVDLVNAFYWCNNVKDKGSHGRRTLMIPGRNGNLYIRNYIRGSDTESGYQGWRSWYKYGGTEVIVDGENQDILAGGV